MLPGPLWGKGGLYFVNLMILTTKNNKIIVKIAGYGVLREYEQAANLNLEDSEFFFLQRCGSWQLGRRNARRKNMFVMRSWSLS